MTTLTKKQFYTILGVSIGLLLFAIVIIIIVCCCCSKEPFNNTNSKYERTELGGKVSKSSNQLIAREAPLMIASNPNINRIIAENIHFTCDPISNLVLEKTNKFHQKYEQNQNERITTLEKLTKELNQPKTLVIMYYCKNYFSLFLNWIKSCETNNIPVKKFTIGFALDKEAYDKTIEIGFKCYLLDPNKYEQGGGSGQYGDSKFAATMYYKNSLMDDILNLSYSPNVLFQDSDLIWVRNPIPYLEDNVSKNEYDVQIMYDGPNRNFQNLYANSGFIFIRNCEETRAMMETAVRNSAYIFQSGSHQKPLDKLFQHYIDHNIIKLLVLPENTFINGHLFGLDANQNNLPKDWKQSGYVIHVSWTLNKEKKLEKMKKYGMNYL